MKDKILYIQLTMEERDFIVDNALNGLFHNCHDKLKEDLGVMEQRNVMECRDLAKRLMIKLNRYA